MDPKGAMFGDKTSMETQLNVFATARNTRIAEMVLS